MEGETGSTLNSHRLIALAGEQGLEKQDKLVEALFKAYFTQVPHTCSSQIASRVVLLASTLVFSMHYSLQKVTEKD